MSLLAAASPSLSPADWQVLAPLIVLVGGSVLVMGVELVLPAGRSRRPLSWLGTAVCVLTGLVLLQNMGLDSPRAVATFATGDRGAVSGWFMLDPMGAFVGLIILLSMILSLLLGPHTLARRGRDTGEFYMLTLFAGTGAMLLAFAGDMVMVFMGIEVMSIAVYVLAGYDRSDLRAGEAGMKYFLTGAFASCFLLMGMAFLYGASGTTDIGAMGLELGRIAAAAADGGAAGEAWPLALIGLALFLVGLGFKIGAVPFHMWVPDVYEGAPTAVTVFMSTGVKAAAVGAGLRIFVLLTAGDMPIGVEEAGEWNGTVGMVSARVLSALAVVTMVVGNLGALAQGSFKRMLAYSSVAHVGYLLVGFTAIGSSTLDGSQQGVLEAGQGVLYYLLAYAVMTAGAFGVLTLLTRGGREVESTRDLAGLSRTRPALAACMAVFLVSLAGIPPTAGFFGKLFVFRSAVGAGATGLAVIAVLNSALALYYYLYPIVVMYMHEPEAGYDDDEVRAPYARGRFAADVFLFLTLMPTIVMGLLPNRWLNWAADAMSALLALR